MTSCVCDGAYRDADVLDLFRGERITSLGAEALHPDVGDTVREDNRGLDELGGDRPTLRRTVPCPAKVRERAEETCERDQTVAPKDPALYRYELVYASGLEFR